MSTAKAPAAPSDRICEKQSSFYLKYKTKSNRDIVLAHIECTLGHVWAIRNNNQIPVLMHGSRQK